jgi:hypothetical protein
MGVGRLSPLTLEDVYQVIDTSSNSVKNVVYAILSPPMFVETWGRFPIAAVANGPRTLHGKATFRVDFSLDHSFEISSMEFPAQVSSFSFFVYIGSTIPLDLFFRTVAAPAACSTAFLRTLCKRLSTSHPMHLCLLVVSAHRANTIAQLVHCDALHCTRLHTVNDCSLRLLSRRPSC